MITVEDLLMAFASAYDAWLDPDAERKNPVPEYAALIRQAVNYENDTLGRGECEIYRVGNTQDLRMCSACGKLMHFNHPLDRDCLNYCPNCGKAVKR